MTIEPMKLQEPLEDLEIEDLFSNITADLVEYKAHEPFINRLFSHQAGIWLEIADLVQDLPDIKAQLQEINERYDGNFQVSWLEGPDGIDSTGYCLMVFLADTLQWTNVAIYNKARFFRN